MILSDSTTNPVTKEALPTEDKKSLIGFNDPNRFDGDDPDIASNDIGVTGVTLNVDSIVQITKNADDGVKTIQQ